MLSPSLRNIPFSGIEWSYQLKDQGYNEKGEKLRVVGDEEDSNLAQSSSPSREIEMQELSTS